MTTSPTPTSISSFDTIPLSSGEPTLSGWMMKQGSFAFVKNWRRRFFVLHADERVLEYYRSTTDPFPAARINLSHFDTLTPTPTTSSPFTFLLFSSSFASLSLSSLQSASHRTHFTLSCSTEDDYASWTSALRPCLGVSTVLDSIPVRTIQNHPTMTRPKVSNARRGRRVKGTEEVVEMERVVVVTPPMTPEMEVEEEGGKVKVEGNSCGVGESSSVNGDSELQELTHSDSDTNVNKDTKEKDAKVEDTKVEDAKEEDEIKAEEDTKEKDDIEVKDDIEASDDIKEKDDIEEASSEEVVQQAIDEKEETCPVDKNKETQLGTVVYHEKTEEITTVEHQEE